MKIAKHVPSLLRAPGSIIGSGVVMAAGSYAFGGLPASWPDHNMMGLIAALLAAGALIAGSLLQWAKLRQCEEQADELRQKIQQLGESKEIAALSDLPTTREMPSDWHLDAESLKIHASMLFIDDEDFDIPRQLRDEGFNVHHLLYIDSLEHIERIDADIVFCDIGGVASSLFPGIEGAGVIKHLKRRTSIPPVVVAYTSTRPEVGSPQNEIIHTIADARLQKNAQPEDYVQTACNLLSMSLRPDIDRAASAVGQSTEGPITITYLLRILEILQSTESIDRGSQARGTRRLLAAIAEAMNGPGVRKEKTQ